MPGQLTRPQSGQSCSLNIQTEQPAQLSKLLELQKRARKFLRCCIDLRDPARGWHGGNLSDLS